MNKIARKLAVEKLSSYQCSDYNEALEFNRLVPSNHVKNYLCGKVAVEEVDDVEKKALAFIFIYGHTIDEVAKKMNIPMEIIKTKLRTVVNKILAADE